MPLGAPHSPFFLERWKGLRRDAHPRTRLERAIRNSCVSMPLIPRYVGELEARKRRELPEKDFSGDDPGLH